MVFREAGLSAIGRVWQYGEALISGATQGVVVLLKCGKSMKTNWYPQLWVAVRLGIDIRSG